MVEALGLLASFLKLTLRTELEQQGHSASGKLSQSIDVVVNETMTGFELVGQAVYYAKWVNDGRKAGSRGVPIESLIEWIRQRKINLERIMPNGRVVSMKEQSVAFMLQSSIKEKGIAPSLFITKTLSDNEQTIDDKITEAMGNVLDTYIEQMFNEIKAA